MMTSGTPTPAKTHSRARWRSISFWLVLAPLTGLLGLILALGINGAQTAATLSDPGALTRWGLPIARWIHHMALSIAVAAAILAATVVPVVETVRRRRYPRRGSFSAHPVYLSLLRICTVAGVVWALAALTVLVLSFSALSGLPLSADTAFSEGLFDYVTSIDSGRAWAVVTMIAAVFAMLSAALRHPMGMAGIALLGLGAIIPMALVGHSSSAGDHTAAVNSLGLHLLGVVIWVGGLCVLLLLSPPMIGYLRQARGGEYAESNRLIGTVLRRYSTLAGLALVTVAASGVVNASIRFETWGQLLETGYGQLLLIKTVLILALAALGWMHRRYIIPRLSGSLVGGPQPGHDDAAEPAAGTLTEKGTASATETGAAETGAGTAYGNGTAPGAEAAAAGEKTTRPDAAPQRSIRSLLVQLLGVEAALMAAVVAVSAVLSQSPPPVLDEITPEASPARTLTGYELPVEPSLLNYFTQWRIDWFFLAIIAFLAIWYLRAMITLRRRGDSWHPMRAVSWIFGLSILFWITSGGPAVYGMVLFSGHMIQHMTLTMVAPIFLVMGSPVTLALRVLPARRDATRGPREWIMIIVHSRFSRLVTHPIVAAVNFAGSLVVFYYTPIFAFALEYHLGHILMTIHFLLTGYIFALVLIGRDPLPQRPPHAMRLIILLATMVFHAFLAVAISSSEALLVPQWFGNMGHGWMPALADQQTGGQLMWGLGEVPAVILTFAVALQWSRDDSRETRRLDREADRSHDAELNAYNDMFAAMAERDNRR